MAQKSIDRNAMSEQVRAIKSEIRLLDQKRQSLEDQLKALQQGCNHDFIETAFMRKCSICKWTESIYY